MMMARAAASSSTLGRLALTFFRIDREAVDVVGVSDPHAYGFPHVAESRSGEPLPNPAGKANRVVDPGCAASTAQ